MLLFSTLLLHIPRRAFVRLAVTVDNALNFQTAQECERQMGDEHDRLRLLLAINNGVVSHLGFRSLFRQIAAPLRPVPQLD